MTDMEIGKPERVIHVEPAEEPVPSQVPAPEPVVEPAPAGV
jgi:hypothetical protein